MILHMKSAIFILLLSLSTGGCATKNEKLEKPKTEEFVDIRSILYSELTVEEMYERISAYLELGDSILEINKKWGLGHWVGAISGDESVASYIFLDLGLVLAVDRATQEIFAIERSERMLDGKEYPRILVARY